MDGHEGDEQSFLDILNAPVASSRPAAAANNAFTASNDVPAIGDPDFFGSWDDMDAQGEAEDEEGEDYDHEFDEGMAIDTAETHAQHDQNAVVEDVPDDVGLQLDQATADAGLDTQGSRDFLWEEDEEAIREIEESAGFEGWGDEPTQSSGRGRGKKRGRRVKSSDKQELTDEQAEIVGQANLAYMRGEYATAVKLLHEVIQGAPNAYQAWVTLAMIHDELGDTVKAMRTYMMAAHLSPKDTDLWTRLGAMSRKFGQNDQALYCFNHAISADPENVDALWDRAAIYHERGMMQKAITDLEALLEIIPHNMPAVKELCKIYVELNDAGRAIPLFEAAFKADETHPIQVSSPDAGDDEEADDDDEQVLADVSMGVKVTTKTRIGYEELNMLAELYMEIGDYEKTLVTIKQGLRRIQGRTEERHWDEHDDDREYTEDEVPESRELPIQLQVKLGICRIWLDQPEIAKMHFAKLYARPVNDFAELYFEVAEAYMGKRMFSVALTVFEVLRDNPSTDSAIIWSKMGYCYHHLGNFEIASELYEAVLDANPDDFDVKLALAQVCEELGDEDRALRLIAEVDAESRAAVRDQGGDTAAQGKEVDGRHSDGTPTQSGSEAVVAFIMEKQRNVVQDQATKDAMEAARRREALVTYERVMTLWVNIKEKVSRTDFLRTARTLITSFQNTKAFYPTNRAQKYRGLNPRLKTRKGGVQHEIQEMSDRLRPGMTKSARQDQLPVNLNEFLGLKFDQWYDLFVKYAYAAVMDGKEEEAQSTLMSAFDANVFYHDELRKIRLRLHMISVAIYGGNAVHVTDQCRWFCQTSGYPNDVYRIYSAMHAGGSEAVQCYGMNSSVKYFMRQLKAMDKGAKTQPYAPENRNALLLTTYGHLLQAGRSYLAAIAFYVKAYHLCPNDPLINFSLGLAHIQRGMQRKSDNRHMHMMQGFTFVMRYHQLRGENVEANFNVARAFHHVGLNNLAIPYYEKILEASRKGKLTEDEQDLKGEAAYNLSLIYISSGSPGLAEIVLRKHCTF
ncbi:uncharacterized protein EV422DRAFT_520401 [Fimicolochytrium jonesii]|uniref:uncharacterized protein n=1 Tax=Fimicolochytrium jonesii TaxID=1396493 RepID=UPI0022FE2A0A|nr:uncharacterized protein EV422DRAFT_520401 [Fimicolochytrium jonesii]KAI8824526.1 hypothetical protein EV422DRAFT_520401 [Fimicolochytrium jonesii]